MEQSRILEWNQKDNVSLSLLCQVDQEWMEMLQNPEIMRQFIMTKRKENGGLMIAKGEDERYEQDFV